MSHGLEQPGLLLTPWLEQVGEPTPSWTTLRSKPRQRAERPSQKSRNPPNVGDTQPQGRALGAPRFARRPQGWVLKLGVSKF
eukprot:13372841-Alexandrium_andersonii.AAC.1